jgi:hypothetical protein
VAETRTKCRSECVLTLSVESQLHHVLSVVVIPPSKFPEAQAILKCWLPRYPVDVDGYPWVDFAANKARQASESKWLQGFAGLSVLTPDQVHELIGWKWSSRRPNLKKSIEGFESNRVHADTCIRAALQQTDSDTAVDALRGSTGGIPNWQCAMASVVLAACRPTEFTVADSRSLRTVMRLRGSSQEVIDSVRYFPRSKWSDYIVDCRDLSSRLRVSLRVLDQTLWAAAGNPAK